MHDEDNDGRFPDESPVEVRYPRSKQEERGDRERWPWLPGTIVEQCGPDEWYVCIEVRELAVLRDGRRAPRGTASRNLYYPCCYRGQLGDPATIGIEWPGIGAARGEPVSGDRVIRFATAAVVCAVAAFAAVVSYSHIYGLGQARGQDGTAARLLPLSVDGLILAASLVLLHEARNGRDAPGLPGSCYWLGIGATVGANIAFGAGYGLLGALISAWPAVAFIGSVEIAMEQVRRARAPRATTSGPGRARGTGRCGAGGPRRVRGVGCGRAAAEPAGHGRAVRPVPAQGEPARRSGHRVRQWPPTRERGSMSMKSYDELPWWCQLLWPWFGPPWYEQVEDLDAYLAAYWCALHLSAAELAELLAGDDPPGEGYLAKVRRLTAARHQAQEIISHEYGQPVPADEDTDDEYGEPIPGMGRLLVVGRDYPSWPKVDAEQRERIGDPPGENGPP